MFKTKSRAVDSPKNGDAANSRQQLLEAGTRLFAMHGLEGASVRDIAQEAGINVCMISYHFGGKEGLYRACLEEYGRARLESARGILESPRSSDEFKVRLKLYVTALADHQAQRPEFSRMIAKEIEAGLPVASDIFEATFLKIMEDVVRFFGEAQKAGLIREDRDPLALAHMLYGTLGHVTRCDSVGKKYFNCSILDSRNREKLVTNLVETLWSGVVKQDE